MTCMISDYNHQNTDHYNDGIMPILDKNGPKLAKITLQV